MVNPEDEPLWMNNSPLASDEVIRPRVLALVVAPMVRALASEPESKPPEARVRVSNVVPVKATVTAAPFIVRELIVWPPLLIVAFAAMRRLLVATEAEKVPVCSTLLIWRMPVTAS